MMLINNINYILYYYTVKGRECQVFRWGFVSGRREEALTGW